MFNTSPCTQPTAPLNKSKTQRALVASFKPFIQPNRKLSPIWAIFDFSTPGDKFSTIHSWITFFSDDDHCRRAGLCLPQVCVGASTELFDVNAFQRI